VLAQRSIRTLDELRAAARSLAEKYGVPFLVKGGHLPGAKQAVDVLFDGKGFREYARRWFPASRPTAPAARSPPRLPPISRSVTAWPNPSPERNGL